MASTLESPSQAGEPGSNPAPKFDAKAYLERTLPRKPGDVLKVFPMHGRHAFRVNWYSGRASREATIPGLSVAYIRQSQYLFCCLNQAGVPEITYPARQ